MVEGGQRTKSLKERRKKMKLKRGLNLESEILSLSPSVVTDSL